MKTIKFGYLRCLVVALGLTALVTTLANAATPPSIPVYEPDAPEHPFFVSVKNGPFFVNLTIPAGLPAFLWVDYAGTLCPYEFAVGIVQHDHLVRTVQGSIGSYASCSAYIPLDGLTDGEVELFAVNSRGQYDSNNGSNFSFMLQLPAAIHH